MKSEYQATRPMTVAAGDHQDVERQHLPQIGQKGLDERVPHVGWLFTGKFVDESSCAFKKIKKR